MSHSPSLPIIDISPFLNNHHHHSSLKLITPQQLKTASAIHQACTSKGFFYLIGHNLTQDLLSETINVTREFLLESTEAQKHSLSIHLNDFARGYQRKGHNLTQGKSDWHEAFDLYAASPFDDQDDLVPPSIKVLGGQNLWPQTPERFKGIIEEYIELMLGLGEVLMRATGLGLGLEDQEIDELMKLVEDSFWLA